MDFLCRLVLMRVEKKVFQAKIKKESFRKIIAIYEKYFQIFNLEQLLLSNFFVFLYMFIYV